MKKAIILSAIIVMAASCSTIKPSERQIYSYFLDFRPYSDTGFFLSPDPYTGEFTSLGEILIDVYPAEISNKEISNKESRFKDGIYEKERKSPKLVTEKISESELLEIAVKKAKDLGANGIANFKCLSSMSTYYSNGSLVSTIRHYEISGLCIKITQKH